MFRAYTCRTYSQTIFEPQKCQRFFWTHTYTKGTRIKDGTDTYLFYFHVPSLFSLFQYGHIPYLLAHTRFVQSVLLLLWLWTISSVTSKKYKLRYVIFQATKLKVKPKRKV